MQLKLDTLLKEKAEIETQFETLSPAKGMTKVYRDVHTMLDKIARSFKSAKERNLRQFLNKLSEQANDYLERLNPGDFHGRVSISERANGKAKINPQLCIKCGTCMAVCPVNAINNK